MILQQEPYHQEQQQAGRLYNRITPINNSSINNNISSNDINEDCFYTPPKYGGGGGGGLKKKYPLPPIALPLTSGSGGSGGSGGRSGERPSRSEIHSILNHGIEIAMESDDDEEISYGDDYEEYNEWDLGTGHAIEEEKQQDEVDDVVQFCIPHQQQPRQSIQSQKLQRGGNGEGGALSSALYDYCDNNDNGVVICQTGNSGVGNNNKTCAQGRRRTNFLAPILEERQVTFAAQHVVSRTRGSCNELKMVHTVLDAISVWFIPHYTEYTQNESSHMWYTQNEMHTMKDNYLLELAADTAAAKAKKQQRKEQVCQLFSLLCSPKTTSSSDTGTDNNGDTTDTDFYTDEFHHCRRCRYETSLCAVLNEQYEQRLMCQQVYGRVDNGYSGILDPDQLALVYTTLGNTTQCQRIAEERAMKLQQNNDDHDHDGTLSSSSSLSSYDDDEHHDHQDSITNTNIDSPRATRVTTAAAAAADGSDSNNNNSKSLSKSTSTSSLSQKPSTCFFTISSGFNTCIDSLFQVLLTPILELRPKGDIFLGIGEEMDLS